MDSRKLVSVLAVTLVVATSCSCAFLVFDDQEEDGSPIVVGGTANTVNVLIQIYKLYSKGEKIANGGFSTSSLLAGILLGMPIGYEIEKLHLEQVIEELKEEIKELEQQAHLNQAKNTTTTIGAAAAFTENSLNNYGNIWKMSEEHWVRQAEMAAFSQWSIGSDFDPEAVMMLSMIYFNDAMMGANAVAQFNTFMAELSRQVDTLGKTKGYSDNISAYYSLDGTKISSGKDFDGGLMAVADTRENGGCVYIQTELFDTGAYVKGVSDQVSEKPGTLYLFGSDSVTLTDREGRSFHITEKKTDLTGIDGFGSGIYSVSKGAVLASDAFAEASGIDGCIGLVPGLVMSVDGVNTLAEYRNGTILVVEDGKNDRLVSSLALGMESSDIPDGKHNPDAVSLVPSLRSYALLLERMRTTSGSAESSARSLWNIYNAAGESNAWTTTLSVLDNYENIALSDSMKTAMSVSAMQQIADYYGSHNGDLAGMKLGLIGENSRNVPFVRGTIYDDHGNTVASDMIFTPMLQTGDAVLKKQENFAVDSYATAMVWAQGENILSWASSGDFSDFTVIPLRKGYSFSVNELAVKDDDSSPIRSVNYVELNVKQIDYVPGVGFVWYSPDPIDPVHTGTNYLEIVCIIAGALLILYGLLSRRIGIIVLGAGVLVFAFVLADTVWYRLSHLRWFS